MSTGVRDEGISYSPQKRIPQLSDYRKWKNVQYADDCIAFLNNKNELYTVLNLISEYGKASGLTLNLSKCEGIWLGVNKTRQKDCKLFGIKWPDQNRCLGIYVGYSRDKNLKRNWDEKIDKIKHILTGWKDRGKVQIIKTFVVSQFVLPASLLVVQII